MKVTDAETGAQFQLRMDDEVQRELSEHYASRACENHRLEIRRAIVSGGQVQFKQQCLDCGEPVGTAISHAKAPKDAADFDHSIAQRRRAMHEQQYQAIIQKHVKLQKSKDSAFWRKYDKYLATPEWAAKRARVLKRAGGICEGCLEQPATQVHHLTYRHWPNEFMFELVAICKGCHERLHAADESDSDKAEDEPDSDEDDGYDASPCCACRYQDERGHEQWCGKFDITAAASMATDGPCGPRQFELEPLK
jgi:hypothetical protein